MASSSSDASLTDAELGRGDIGQSVGQDACTATSAAWMELEDRPPFGRFDGPVEIDAVDDPDEPDA